MAAQTGRTFLLKQGTAAGGTSLAGLRVTSLTVNQALVDVTTKDSTNQWRDLLAGVGIRSLSIQAGGVFQAAAVDTTLRGYALAGSINAFGIVTPDGVKWDASFLITSYQRSGPYNTEEDFSITLESSGAVTIS